MDSPGHRANVLSREATHVGVGVVFGREVAGRREVFVTQLFVRRPMGGDARQGERQVLEIIEKRRRDKGLAELPRDGALDRAAQEFSAAVAKGRASRDQGQQATRRASELAAGRFGAIEALFVELPEAARLPDVRLFYDTSVRAVGIGVSLGDSPKIGPGALYVTVVLGKSR